MGKEFFIVTPEQVALIRNKLPGIELVEKGGLPGFYADPEVAGVVFDELKAPQPAASLEQAVSASAAGEDVPAVSNAPMSPLQAPRLPLRAYEKPATTEDTIFGQQDRRTFLSRSLPLTLGIILGGAAAIGAGFALTRQQGQQGGRPSASPQISTWQSDYGRGTATLYFFGNDVQEVTYELRRGGSVVSSGKASLDKPNAQATAANIRFTKSVQASDRVGIFAKGSGGTTDAEIATFIGLQGFDSGDVSSRRYVGVQDDTGDAQVARVFDGSTLVKTLVRESVGQKREFLISDSNVTQTLDSKQMYALRLDQSGGTFVARIPFSLNSLARYM